jgi:hypothetical protein
MQDHKDSNEHISTHPSPREDITGIEIIQNNEHNSEVEDISSIECDHSTSTSKQDNNGEKDLNINVDISADYQIEEVNNDIILDLILNHPLDTKLDEDTTDIFDDYFPQAEESEEIEGEGESDAYELHQETSTVNLETPIYPGHNLTISKSMLIVWLYAITHSITGAQFSDLLMLLNIHLMTSHPAFNSLYMFKNFFSKMKSSYVKHWFCKNCLSPCKEHDVICNNSLCMKDLSKTNAKEYFMELNLETQLKTLFSRTEFVKLIKRQKKRVKRNPCHYEDITDGVLYKELIANGKIGNNTYDLTFTLNTDGIPIFKSSRVSAWPVFLMINELPYSYRRKTDYMILCGLWFGDQKPCMNMLLKPLHRSLCVLKEGIKVHVNQKEEYCHGYLICLSADLPAKSLALNMVQFNGQSSCIKCLQPGCNFRTVTKGNVHIFPYQDENPDGPPRTSDSVKVDAHKATTTKTNTHGIKGPSFLMMTESFDYVRSTAVDYMHCALLGIERLLTNLWFLPKHAKELFSLYSYLDLVDSRLSQIKPPGTISRLPRSISEHFKFWKASELRSWMLYYSLPVLHDIMHYDYFYHYAAFVCAIHTLCQDSISENEIILSEKLLNYFVLMTGSLYGDRYLTLNIHSLLHLPQCVRELGPLWGHSCFPFENANGDLQKFFHGTQFIDMQIVNAVNIVQQLPLLTQHVKPQSIAYNFVNHLLTKGNKHHLLESSSHSVLGRSYAKNVPDEIYMKLALLLGFPPQKIQFFSRAIIDCQIYHSKDYSRVQVRNSTTVCYLNCNNCPCYGIILYFILHSGIESENIFCVIQPFTCHRNDIIELSKRKSVEAGRMVSCEQNLLDLKLDFIQVCTNFSAADVEIVPVEKILYLAVNVNIENLNFICREPNNKEFNL